jgi:O-antigen/teichoic acid export membrane protein
MDTSSLTYKTFKNISYRFVAFVWPMIFSILITPIIVLKLGVKDYGIYVFIGTITGMLGLLDLGISYAITKFLAEYKSQDETGKVKRMIYSANSLFLIIGLIGLAITILLSIGGNWLFASRLAGQQFYLILFILAGTSFFISSINNLYNIIPEALQRYDISSKLNIIYLTLTSLSILTLVLLGYKLVAIFISQLVFTLLFAFVRRHYALKILPLAKYRLGWNKEEIKYCYRFGLATVVNNTSSTLLASLDRLIIPIFMGPSQLTYYSLPGNVAARIPGVTDNLSGIIFPVSASINSTGDKEKINRLYIRSVRLITIIASAISLSVIFLAYPIMRYWISVEIADRSTYVLIILTLTNFTIALLSPINAFFYGLGRLKFSTILNTVMAILNALLLFVLLPRFGITGVAWAYLLSILPIFYMIYFMEKKYLCLTGRSRYYRKTLWQISSSAVIFFFIVKFLISPLITSFATLAVLGPSTVIIYLLLYKILGFWEKEDWQDLKKFFLILIERIKKSAFEQKRGLNGNEKEAIKLKIKLWFRSFVPSFILPLIRRRQVPLDKMLKFQKDFAGKKINEPTKTETLAIVIPCYNHSQYLLSAFESIINQTRLPEQVILIDDCSHDDTYKLIKKLVSDHQDNNPTSKTEFIVEKNEKNLGQALTINKAINLAKTDLIMILNDDDYLMHDAIEIVLSLFQKNRNLALIGFSNIIFDNNGFLEMSKKLAQDYYPTNNLVLKITGPSDALNFEDFCNLNMTHTSSTFSREKALSVGLYREKRRRIIRFSDRDFQIRMNLLYSVGTTGEIPLCFWRSNSSIDAGKNS